jgi:hypothetical protein
MPFMNRLSMNERQTIIGLLRLRWPERRIARETGFHRATIRRIARELAAELTEPQSVPEVATDLPPSRSSCEPHRSFIEVEAAKGRNAVAIFQDLVEHHGYEGRVQRGQAFRRQTATSGTESQLPV